MNFIGSTGTSSRGWRRELKLVYPLISRRKCESDQILNACHDGLYLSRKSGTLSSIRERLQSMTNSATRILLFLYVLAVLAQEASSPPPQAPVHPVTDEYFG